jgi:hypothetical protein
MKRDATHKRALNEEYLKDTSLVMQTFSALILVLIGNFFLYKRIFNTIVELRWRSIH